jgi:heme exporter protein C
MALKKSWWKILAVALIAYAFIGGLLLPVPARPIVNESIRNLYYHVPMWFGMIIIMTVGVVNAIKYLRTSHLVYDIYASRYGATGMLLGLLGIVTGAIWANYTWGAPMEQ